MRWHPTCDSSGEKPVSEAVPAPDIARDTSDRPGQEVSDQTLQLIGGAIILLVCLVPIMAIWWFGWPSVLYLLLWVVIASLAFSTVWATWTALEPTTTVPQRNIRLVAGGVLVCLALVIFSNLQPSPVNTVQSPANVPPIPTTVPVVEQRSKEAIATEENWLRMQKIVSSLNGIANCGQQQSLPGLIDCLDNASNHFSAAAGEISVLPTKDVDPEVVELAAAYILMFQRSSSYLGRMQRLYSDRQQLEKYANSPEAFMESALRGFADDPFGKYNEIQAKNQQLGAEFQDGQREIRKLTAAADRLRSDEHRLRGTLSKKFGVEFPAMY